MENECSAMTKLHDALAKVPEQFQAEVCTRLTHDIYITLQAIEIAGKKAG